MKQDYPQLALQEVSSDSTVFDSPFGRFRMKPHRTLPGEIELWLDDSCWDRYETVQAAKAALLEGKLGMPEWDRLCTARSEKGSH